MALISNFIYLITVNLFQTDTKPQKQLDTFYVITIFILRKMHKSVLNIKCLYRGEKHAIIITFQLIINRNRAYKELM